MPPKKGKKKGTKKKGKKKADPEDGEEKKESDEFKVTLPTFGWIKIKVSLPAAPHRLSLTPPVFCLQLRLCDAPTPQYNWFDVYMLTSQRVRMIKKQVVDHHGRIENIKIFNVDPTPFMKEAKQKQDDRIKAEKEAKRARLEAEENGEEVEETKQAAVPVEEVEEEKKEPDYVEYTEEGMTIYDIFGNYGLETKGMVDEDEACQKELYYDFTPFNSKDPVLLSLMTAKKYN